ncbi:M2 family metallopeptidase [Planctomycetota bacterium]
MKTLLILIMMLIAGIFLFGCAPRARQNELEGFITAHVEKIKPLQNERNLATWNAATTGKSEDYERAGNLTLKIRQIYSNPKEFAFLEEVRKSGKVSNVILARQSDLLYNHYLENQIEPELLKQIVDLSSKIERTFNTHRGKIEIQEVTDNEIREVLKTQTDSLRRKRVWLASKQVGAVVADDVIRLVKLRNQAAQNLKFNNFHTLSLAAVEQDVKELDRVFDELYELTNEPFARLKADLDRILAAKYDVGVTELMPWHYHDPFFQETPMVYNLDLDTYYENKNVKELAARFYADIDLPVETILVNSDLYEREGKNPHAFCEDMNRQGDVRILCNIKNNEYWMEVTLHELGHGVYFKYNNSRIPYLLRQPAHTFVTEAIAMFFGRLSRHPFWMQQMLDLSDQQRTEIEKVSDKYAQLKQLIFARWAMVMYNFEKQLYANPDQDLNALWWQMVEKYQLVKKPQGRDKPDWASKIHIPLYPCYYHNYLLGELLASQLHNHIVHKVLKLESDKNVSYVSQKKAGDFLRKNVFEVGAVYHWNEMIERATGEPLTPKYFVRQFVK